MSVRASARAEEVYDTHSRLAGSATRCWKPSHVCSCMSQRPPCPRLKMALAAACGVSWSGELRATGRGLGPGELRASCQSLRVQPESQVR